MVLSDSAPFPRDALVGLRKWLNETFGWNVTNVGNVLKRPHQTDPYSCAICAMSTIAHGIFGDPLWRQRDASAHRIRWFIKLGEGGKLDVPRAPVGKPADECAPIDAYIQSL